MSLSRRIVQGNRLEGGLFSERQSVAAWQLCVVAGDPQLHACETGVSGGIVRIERNGLAEIFQSCARAAVAPKQHWIIAAKVKLIRGDVARGAALDARECARAQPQVEFSRNGAGNFALDREYVLQLAIVDFRPPRRTVPRIHQPDLNAEP